MFRRVNFLSHSGIPLGWKIECDDLSDEEIGIFAEIIAGRGSFGQVFGIPRGGLRLANALEQWRVRGDPTLLIVDDVLTTGASMEAARRAMHGPMRGAVMFARGKCPEWVQPVFQLVGS